MDWRCCKQAGHDPPHESAPLTGAPRAAEPDPKAPVRGPLSPEVERAARTVHAHVWTGPYRPGEGPMHYAGGPYWHDELLRLADQWERWAAAARVCAETLPDA
jgi:hypothetical protein